MDRSTFKADQHPRWDRDDDFEGAVLNLGELPAPVSQQILARLLSKDFRAWSGALAAVGNCVRPVRLRGSLEKIDLATGEVLSSFSTAVHPLGVMHVRCGNRRASECPPCSRLYAADMFHLIRAGVTGGKTVPESVAAHPLLFATLAAAAPTAARLTAESSTLRALRDDGPPVCSGSRCVLIATTTPPMWCGSGSPPTCGDASPSHFTAPWLTTSASPLPAFQRWPRCSTPRWRSFNAAEPSTSTPLSGSTVPARLTASPAHQA